MKEGKNERKRKDWKEEREGGRLEGRKNRRKLKIEGRKKGRKEFVLEHW